MEEEQQDAAGWKRGRPGCLPCTRKGETVQFTEHFRNPSRNLAAVSSLYGLLGGGIGGGAAFRCGCKNVEKSEGLRWPLGSLKPIAGGKSKLGVGDGAAGVDGLVGVGAGGFGDPDEVKSQQKIRLV